MGIVLLVATSSWLGVVYLVCPVVWIALCACAVVNCTGACCHNKKLCHRGCLYGSKGFVSCTIAPPPCLRISNVLPRNQGVVLVHYCPTKQGRRTRGWFLRTAMSSSVPQKKNFPAHFPAGMCAFSFSQ